MIRTRVSTALVVTLFLIGIGAPASADEQSQIDFANGLFSRGFYEEAAVEYRAYVSDFPNGGHLTDALYRLGEAEAASKNFDAALDALDRLLASDVPDDLRRRAALRRGVVLYHLKRYDDAQTALSPMTEAGAPQPVRAEALYYVGKSHFEASEPEKALSAFQTLIRDVATSPLVAYARYQVAFIHLSMDQYENAAVEFSEVAATKGADESLRMESRFRAAEVYDQIGWFDAAVQAYQQLRAEFPGSDYAQRASYGYSWALYHAGKYDEAYIVGGSYLKDNPDSPRNAGVMYLQGNCLQQQKKYAEALDIYNAIGTQYPRSEFASRGQYKSAWSLYMAGDAPRAKTVLQSFMGENPQSSLAGDAAYLLGMILLDEGRAREALQHFSVVTNRHPQSEFADDALYRSAECLRALGQASDAAQAYDRFARAFPQSPLAAEAVFRSGNEDFREGSFDSAVKQYERVLQMAPQAALEEQALYGLATARHNQKEFESSSADFTRLLKKYPSTEHKAEAHLRLGDFLLREQNEALKAMESFQSAYSADKKGPYAGRALRGLALARFETKDFEGAAEGFLRVIRDHPDIPLNEEAYTWVGQHLFDREEWEQASIVFQALLENVPDFPYSGRVYLMIAEANERVGNADDAETGYLQVISAAPKSPAAAEARFRLAGIHESRGDMEDAKRFYEDAANINSGDTAARARFRLAELHEKNGDFDAAARNYMRVVILFYHEELSPEALLRAGRCFEKQEAWDRATATYEELIDKHPDSSQAGKAKTRVQELQK